MAIDRLEIKDFLVFSGEYAADFCHGVNVIIGENGTGKTSLLKAMYRLCGIGKNRETEEYFIASGRTSDLFYRTPFEYIRMLILSENVESRISVQYSFSDGPNPDEYVYLNGGLTVISPDEYVDEYTKAKPKHYDRMRTELVFTSENYEPISSVFIPATNLLPQSRALLEMLGDYEMDFDATQVDNIKNARRPITKAMKPNCKKVINVLSDIIDGEVLYENDAFFVKKTSGEKVEFATEASGFVRLGLLWKLLRNGLLEAGSILFWDEPENSLNRELIPDVVEVLLTLAANGVQIFLATHDYHFARYFDVRKNKNVSVKFHSLSKAKIGNIDYASSSEYSKLAGNPMERASEKLYASVISDAFGVDDNG